jgi:hypothetical protein
MRDIAVRALVWLTVSRRAEAGESLGSFSMILLFAIVAAGLAMVIISTGVLEPSGGSGTQGIEAPNFEPPNPFD